jgi:hypothetical protein
MRLLCSHVFIYVFFLFEKGGSLESELISKGHDLEERDQVLVYEALSCAQVLVYEALSDLEERDQALVYEALRAPY